MTNNNFAVVYAKDYTPPHFTINSTHLHFDILDQETQVTAKLQISRSLTPQAKNQPLVLDGKELELKSVKLNQRELSTNEYSLDPDSLTVPNIPDQFTLETQVIIKPQENTSLSGLYKTDNNLCTQCESHGFRKITYFLDRPDVLSQFTVTITADRKQYPILLANGNLLSKDHLENNRHSVTWHDPSLKSAYLFALVAGNFAVIEDTFTTLKNRSVRLQIYADPKNIEQCHHAMSSLKAAMRWEELNYNSEYDLDMYMVVAINDFNAGAMENKGLNIFNSDYLLASPDTATDNDYMKVTAVIGHEYFHNWTGNRITCRDWFQIGWKEGITTFREQQFSEDQFSRAMQRINQIKLIRSRQFAEDSSPLAHPIRLQSYIEVANFYTLTVYYKSAEVARMLQTIVGPKVFREIMTTFFIKFDGQAVTFEDFLNTAATVAQIDLTQFKFWYDQKGTPEVTCESCYDKTKKILTLKMQQTSSFPEQQPFYIPILIGAIDINGQEINLQHNLLICNQSQQEFKFDNIASNPILSLARNFSAPIKINYHHSENELLQLMLHDSDPVNRWHAAQELLTNLIAELCIAYRNQETLTLKQSIISAFKILLEEPNSDAAFTAELLQLPSAGFLIENMATIDIEALAQVLKYLKQAIAQQLKNELFICYTKNHKLLPYTIDATAIGERALKNTALMYLSNLDEQPIIDLGLTQLKTANNLTDILGGLTALTNATSYAYIELLETYYHKWQGNHNLINKWLTLNATIANQSAFARIQQLTQHPAFNIKNPSRVLALLRTFTEANPIYFHQADGAAYEFLATKVLEIDSFNPQLAASVGLALTRYSKFDPKRQLLIKQQIARILKQPNLSKNLFEIASKAL